MEHGQKKYCCEKNESSAFLCLYLLMASACRGKLSWMDNFAKFGWLDSATATCAACKTVLFDNSAAACSALYTFVLLLMYRWCRSSFAKFFCKVLTMLCKVLMALLHQLCLTRFDRPGHYAAVTEPFVIIIPLRPLQYIFGQFVTTENMKRPSFS